MALEVLFAFMSGMVSFISPCIIPMIIVYLTTITGFTFEALLKNGSSAQVKKQVFIKTAIFVFAFTIVFTVFGALAGVVSGYLGGFFSTMSIIAGVLFLLLGLNYLGVLKKVFWRFGGMMDTSRLQKFADRWRGKDGMLSYTGVFAIGFIFALVCSHCISPTLVPALALAANTQNYLAGGAVMLAFSLGLGIAFLIAALFFEQTIERLNWIARNKEAVNSIVGIVFLGMGLLLLSGQYLSFVSLIYRLIPWKVNGM